MTNNRSDMPAQPVRSGDNLAVNTGMTIRERMATAAMSAVASDPEWVAKIASQNGLNFETVVAKASVSSTDALLAELERTREGASDE